jgi:hypothetical protein|tara:strand:+ start:522 stop:1307 length:786 start_codon:yes stop_codon:yes gene_type:complete
MQLLPRYLVDNTTTLIADVAGTITEYRPVYSKQLQVYKGIDNVLEFRLLNADQKPVNVTSYTPKFVAFDETNQMVLEKDATILDDGSTVTRGKFKLTVTENELLNIKQQYLSYNIYLVETDGDKVLTYSQPNFGNDGVIYVNGTTFPGPLNSYSVTVFEQEAVGVEIWYSESVDAQPGINGNEALHTAAVYTSAYIGDVVVQATLDNQVTGTTQWADIATMQLGGSETTPTPVNFNGVFSHLRFKATANPADKITKVLIRN